MSQSDNNLGGGSGAAGGVSSTMSEVERTLKSLNGYHEDILDALRTAASHRGASTPTGSSLLLSEEILRKTLADCTGTTAGSYTDYGKRVSASQEKICELAQTHTVMVEGSPASRHHHHTHQSHAAPDDEDDDEVPPCGPLRIRNLEDLIRQLDHHRHAHHMSPSGSEDIQMSETEADRHYRLESSSACSESSQQSRCRGRGDDETRFVYGRYRQPTAGRHQYPHPHHHHHSHQHIADEESIYETADHDRGNDQCNDTPDSESDEFIQAQRQLARWASEEAVSAAGTGHPQMAASSAEGGTTTTSHSHHHQHHFPSPIVTSTATVSESDESTAEGNSIARAPPRHMRHGPPPHDSDNDDSPTPGPSGASSVAVEQAQALLTARTQNKRYPEYKH